MTNENGRDDGAFTAAPRAEFRLGDDALDTVQGAGWASIAGLIGSLFGNLPVAQPVVNFPQRVVTLPLLP